VVQIEIIDAVVTIIAVGIVGIVLGMLIHSIRR
jgi:hypothetical protein